MGSRSLAALLSGFCFLLAAAVSGQDLAESPPRLDVRLEQDPVRIVPGGSSILVARVRVPGGHHAYLDKGRDGNFLPIVFDFSALEERGVDVERTAAPAGEHDREAGVTVLRGEGTYRFALTAAAAASSGSAKLRVRYQLCSDVDGICFMPQTAAVPLRIEVAAGDGPAAPRDSGPGASPGTDVSWNEYLGNLLKRFWRRPLWAALICLLGGLLAAATPCVYPMIPISAQILAKRGQGRWGGLLHSSLYLLGIVAAYFVLGLIAGLSGTGLNTVMRLPWVIILVAVLFAVLAMSMFGVFTLTLPASWTNRVHGLTTGKRGALGTVAMGVGAGLVISPCVGPIVIAILLNVVDSTATGSTGDTASAVYGGMMLAAFGAGVGLPLFAVGLLSRYLPKPGGWMNVVKYCFGVLILAIALLYLRKGLDTAQASGAARVFGYAGFLVLVAGLGVLLFQPLGGPTGRTRRIKRILGGAALALGLGLLALCFTRPDVHLGGGATVAVTDEVVRTGNLRWHRKLAPALAEAEREGKPIFVDFYADWCANCKVFADNAVDDPELNAILADAVLVKIHDTDPAFRDFAEDYAELRFGLPFFLILEPDGTFSWKGTDHRATATFARELQRAR